METIAAMVWSMSLSQRPAPHVSPFLSLSAGLDQWERQVRQFVALRRLPLFRHHRLAKAARVWHHAVRRTKMAAAAKALRTQLFASDPVLQVWGGSVHVRRRACVRVKANEAYHPSSCDPCLRPCAGAD